VKLFFINGNMLSQRYASSPVRFAIDSYQPFVALEIQFSMIFALEDLLGDTPMVNLLIAR
jgi:ubiquinone biosynthesis protein Coq4